jgi:glyoxylase-like metal-dependent hydrolase (beta-lactamase superfamily II)
MSVTPVRPLRFISLAVGEIQSNCHLLLAPDRPQALVVDPGYEADRIDDTLRREGLSVAAYLITHGHFDHVTALAEMVRRHPAPVGLHPADAAWAFSPLPGRFQFFPTPKAPPHIDRAWADGQEWEDAGLRYRVIATPGHSPGGVCLHFPEAGLLVAGDTLFQGSIGRLDLPLAEPAAMADSLRKLLALPDATVVLPGHGPATTIGAERAHNPFLQDLA